MGRRRFLDELDGSLERMLHHDLKAPVAMILAELDSFESLAEWYGYRALDGLLNRLRSQLDIKLLEIAATDRGHCLLERHGTAGFAIALFGSLAAEAGQIADVLCSELRGQWLLDGEPRQVTFSLGCARPDLFPDADGLYALTQTALGRAMALGGARVEYARGNDLMRHGRARILGRDLHRAIRRCELHLEYQPVVELERMSVVGLEALLRWDHPLLGRVSPDDIIPVAARGGLLHELASWVMHHACQDYARLRRQGVLSQLRFLAVNVSRQNLDDRCLPEYVLRALHATGMDPAELHLEITESEVAQDPALLDATVRRLRERGVRIAIDDFGVGYSSLACLHELPVDILKLDRSFMCQRFNDRKGRDLYAIAHAIINLARNVNLEVVAEGVESVEQIALLQSLQCPLAQGYALCRPVPVDELAGHCAVLADSAPFGARQRAG